MWILKPSGSKQGIGIKLIYDVSVIEKALIYKRDKKKLLNEL